MESQGYSTRRMIDLWDTIREHRESVNRVSQLLDDGEFVFYFEFDGSVYGAPEESRIAFATMKHPDPEVSKRAKREMTFGAINLDRIVAGDGTQRVFGPEDLGKIKIIDRETAAEKLGKGEKGKK